MPLVDPVTSALLPFRNIGKLLGQSLVRSKAAVFPSTRLCAITPLLCLVLRTAALPAAQCSSMDRRENSSSLLLLCPLRDRWIRWTTATGISRAAAHSIFTSHDRKRVGEGTSGSLR